MNHSVEKLETTFGAPLILINTPGAELIDFRIYMKSGYQFMQPEKYETAHLLEHCLFEKNKHFASPIDFKTKIESLGATNGGSTSFSLNWYSMQGTKENVIKLVDLLLKLVNDAEISEEIFLQQKEVVKNELNRHKDDNKREMNVRLTKLLKVGIKDYATRVSEVDQNSFEDAIGAYKEYYVPGNYIFMIAGNISKYKEKIIEIIETTHSSRKLGQKRKLNNNIDRDYAQKCEFIEDPKKTTHDFYLRYIIESEDQRLKDIFYGVFSLLLLGSGSRLQNKAREKGLIYSLGSSSFYENKYLNLSFQESVAFDKIVPILQLVIDELKDIFSGNITPEELERAKGFYIGRQTLKYSSIGNLIDYYADVHILEDSKRDLKDHMKIVKKLTKKDIIEFGKSFDFSKWIFGLIGKDAEAKTNEIKKFLLDYSRN